MKTQDIPTVPDRQWIVGRVLLSLWPLYLICSAEMPSSGPGVVLRRRKGKAMGVACNIEMNERCEHS